MGAPVHSNEDVLAAITGLGPPGRPVTKSELAGAVDGPDDTVEEGLDALVESGVLETSVVDDDTRVWWRTRDSDPTLDTFRADLADVLRPLTDPAEIQRAAGRLLADRLDVDRALYIEVFPDGETLQVQEGHLHGERPLLETKHQFSDFGEEIKARLHRGEPLVVDDVRTMEGQSDEQEAAYLAVDIHAYLTVPLLKKGQLVGLFTLHQRSPREWNDLAVEMTRETVEWTWEAVERARAEREVAETNTSLQRLTDACDALIEADATTLRDSVAGLAREVVGCASTTLWCYDGDDGDVRAADSDTRPGRVGSDRPPDRHSDRVWEAFVSAEPTVENDIDPPGGVPEAPSAEPLRSRVLVPLGRHGVLEAASTEPGRFDSGTLDLVETLAATVEAAWDRAEGEAALQRQNRELRELDELNTLIRSIDTALVEADTVAAIDETVCERLAESGRYQFAWIGGYDPDTEAVTPRAWAGVDGSAIEALTDAAAADGDSGRGGGLQGENPLATAIRSGELRTIGDIATDTRAGPWREAALELGARACHYIPLVYEESVYGILAVYATTPRQAGGDTAVLEELGGTIAHAVHATEVAATRRRDSVVELTLQTADAETPLCRLARTTGCVVESGGAVLGGESEPTVVFTASGVSQAALVAAAEESLSFDSLTVLTADDGELLCKARLGDESLAARLQGDSAAVQSLTIDAGVATAVVTLPETAAVRAYLDGVGATGGELELVARHTRERSPDSAQHLRTVFRDQFTPRQQEVLELAYRCGFFETPRVQTGSELADALDIAQSTFNYHLRGAQRTLCDEVFDPT